MRRWIPVLIVVPALSGFGLVLASGGGERDVPMDISASADRAVPVVDETPVDARSERLERSIELKPAAKRSLGVFELDDGRSVRLSTAETTSEKTCLIEEDSRVGWTAGCEEDGLFALRRVAFSVHSDGGPGTFDELYVVGVAAPGVDAVDVVESDGHRTRLRLAEERAFVFESSKKALEAQVTPIALGLIGPSGKLLETVRFPPIG